MKMVSIGSGRDGPRQGPVPEGYGIMEVYGLNAELIDVAYIRSSSGGCGASAAVLNDADAQDRYRKLAPT